MERAAQKKKKDGFSKTPDDARKMCILTSQAVTQESAHLKLDPYTMLSAFCYFTSEPHSTLDCYQVFSSLTMK